MGDAFAGAHAGVAPDGILNTGHIIPKSDSNQTKKEKTMSDLKARFEAAMADSKTLTERPGNATLLKLYALYKQGASGDVEGKRPGFTDMVGRAKYDAWAELKGLAANDAMQQYIDLVAQLKKA
jgi:acyl-CoA-binding protein